MNTKSYSLRKRKVSATNIVSKKIKKSDTHLISLKSPYGDALNERSSNRSFETQVVDEEQYHDTFDHSKTNTGESLAIQDDPEPCSSSKLLKTKNINKKRDECLRIKEKLLFALAREARLRRLVEKLKNEITNKNRIIATCNKRYLRLKNKNKDEMLNHVKKWRVKVPKW